MDNEYIDVKSLRANVDDKLRFEVDGKTDKIYWYVKFNIPLDPASILPTTMAVTDEAGKILQTQITANSEKNYIVIQPLESYLEDYTYILNISKNIRSVNGRNLPEDIQISFRLKGTQIVDMHVIKGGPDLQNKIFSQAAEKNANEVIWPRLPTQFYKMNFFLCLASIVLMGVSIFTDILVLWGVTALCLVSGIAHLVLQLFNKKNKAIRKYNKAVAAFHKKEAKKALALLQEALQYDKSNEQAVHALSVMKKFEHYR